MLVLMFGMSNLTLSHLWIRSCGVLLFFKSVGNGLIHLETMIDDRRFINHYINKGAQCWYRALTASRPSALGGCLPRLENTYEHAWR